MDENVNRMLDDLDKYGDSESLRVFISNIAQHDWKAKTTGDFRSLDAIGRKIRALDGYPAMVDEAGVRFLNDAFIPNPDDFLK